MIIVGICGASGSGKSTLAKEIEDSLTCTSAIIGLDCYYRDHSDLPFEERVHINYDEPDIFDFDQLYADIQRLQGGLPITRKGYDYARHMRADSDELIQPMDVLILEGIHMFRDKRITDLMSLKVYMHVDIDVCLLRRIKRDIRVRGRSIENIAEQYMATVKPMYEEYISKYIREADFAVMRGGRNRMAIDAISAYISAKLLAEKFDREAKQEALKKSASEGSIAMAISFIANMPMCFLENRLFSKWRASKLKRVICVVMAMLFVLSIITVLIVIVGPKLVDSIKSLAENYDSYSKSLIKWGTDVWERLNLNDDIAVKVRQVSEDILDKLDGFISGLASGLLRFTVSTVGVVVDMLFALIISIYALANKENLLCQCRKFIKAVFNEQHAARILDVCARTNKSLHNYVYGMLIECFILGMMCFMGMQILGFPFAVLISVIVGASQMVPIVGPWVSGAIGLSIIFVVDPPRALWFIVFVLAIQQIEGNLIYPKVVGNAVGISGLWVMIAVLFGARLFGLMGAILCVPIMAVLYTLIGEWVNNRLEEKRAIAQRDEK